MSSITPLSPSLSKRLKKLRVKHIMNWEELEQQTMHDSWMYKLINACSPRVIGWITLTLFAVLAIMDMKP